MAVYGDTAEAEYIREQFKDVIIVPSEKEFVKAKRYILFGDEEENLSFFANHRYELSKREVCIRSKVFSMQDFNASQLNVVNVEQIAAKMFWKKHSFYQRAKESGYKLNISIIGFGNRVY